MTVPHDDAVAQCTKLLSSVSDHILRVQSFKGKWSLISKKLGDLRNQLADFCDLRTSSSSNPLAQEVLSSIFDTLTDAVSVAAKCATVDLAEGKLKTQSEVDSVMAKLDRHVRDSDVLIKSGVLDNGAISGSSSKKEAVRVEARNLITRLQIGGSESKNSAMDSLLGLLYEDDKNVMIAVAQGIVPVLVRILDSSSADMKEKTVTAIARVSMVESSKHVLVAEGLFLLNHLLRVLDSGSGFAKEKACIALQALSFTKENARAIGSRGGISSLLRICQAGTPGSQALAAGVLRNLAMFQETKENFIEESAVCVLITLASSGTALAQENAIGCLSNLAAEDEKLKLLVAREGGVNCLKNFWDSVSNVSSLEAAVDLLRNLASCRLIADALVSEGFITRLVTVLSCGVLGVRIAAAKAVYELCYSSKTRKEMGECGYIAPLVEMLDGKALEEREAAAKALSCLLLCSSNQRIFRKDDKGIMRTVQLLDPKIQNMDKRYAVAVLSELLHSKKCRKQMVAAGACVHLQKLGETDVDGAKKLLESLSRSKIWGVFARP